MNEPKVVILGGGPAGVGGAYKLRQTKRGAATLIEQRAFVGGNSGSFYEEGQYLDYGSHRLHSASDPDILDDIRGLLGGDLLDRPRDGRIRLRGEWVKFPLRGSDLILRLDKAFAVGATFDMARRSLPGGPPEGDSFASVLKAKLGPTICDHFYYPYARKLWGRDPSELSGIQAHKRVSANSFSKLLKKVVKPPGSGRFFYPKKGFGQISSAFAEAAQKEGAELMLGWRVEGLTAPSGDEPWKIDVRNDKQTRSLQADHVWSTLPISLVAKMMQPSAPAAVMDAMAKIDYRAMILIYLQLPVDQFTTTDAHYFPEENVRITRLSEPKNYSASTEPKGTTILCAELPCSPQDDVWSMSDEQLGMLLTADIARAGLPLPAAPTRVFSRKLRHAYPIYLQGYEHPLQALDQWAEGLPRFVSYGRQGLFAHDNTHHALHMAYSAVECLENGRFNTAKWAQFKEQFKSHVVED